MNDFMISDFDYYLPINQIANEPLDNRDNSRLMYLNFKSGKTEDKHFFEIGEFFDKGDLIILNDTKVIPGRLFLARETGGKVEILFNKIVSKNSFEAIYSSSKPLKIGTKLFYEEDSYFIVESVKKNYITLSYKFNESIIRILKRIGTIPLPKYIKRSVEKRDKDRYQTIYAREEGSIAAPTAGLHFTNKIINQMLNKDINIESLTLHISYNTFRPISSENYLKHDIGKEFFIIKKQLIEKIKRTKDKGNRVIAVGTTVVRAIEYIFSKNINDDISDYVDLFIYPGYKFKVVDTLLTNFHLPKSTLLLLVCAFGGKEVILNAYNDAVRKNYRFYSYGDCMLIDKL